MGGAGGALRSCTSWCELGGALALRVERASEGRAATLVARGEVRRRPRPRRAASLQGVSPFLARSTQSCCCLCSRLSPRDRYLALGRRMLLERPWAAGSRPLGRVRDEEQRLTCGAQRRTARECALLHLLSEENESRGGRHAARESRRGCEEREGSSSASSRRTGQVPSGARAPTASEGACDRAKAERCPQGSSQSSTSPRVARAAGARRQEKREQREVVRISRTSAWQSCDETYICEGARVSAVRGAEQQGRRGGRKRTERTRSSRSTVRPIVRPRTVLEGGPRGAVALLVDVRLR